MANVTIDIAAQYKGKPAFDKAGKSVSGLEAAVNKLGKSLVGVFATQKVIAFGKATANAFMEDQKSAALLSNTMKNLGLQFANPQIEEFIGKLSTAAGVADDRLRPAMQSLLTTTGSLVKSQKLLSEAVDISRGSGVDLETVVQDLDNAYVGNTKGLKKYNLGLTQAELKAATFADIQKKLNDQFSGSSAAYLGTYAGQMEKLSVAAGEAQETIGKGLIDAFKILAGDNTIGDLSDKMATLATNIADFFRGLAQGFKDLAQMPIIKQLLQLTGAILKIAGKVAGAFIDPFTKAGARSRSSQLASASSNSFLTEHMAASNAAKAKAAEAAAAKRARDAAKAQKDNTAQLKAQMLLKKGQGILDLQQIQLVAALKGDLSEQDRKSAELQLALLNGNDAAASKLTSEILKAQDATGALTKFVNDLSNTKLADPFTAWYKTLSDVEAKMQAIQLQAQGVSVNPNISTNAAPITQLPSTILAQASADYQAGQQTIKLMVEGGDEVTSLMRFKILESSMSGSQAQIDRTLGAFDR